MSEFVELYGPYAFGIFGTVVIWKLIFSPLLDMRKKEISSVETLATSLNTTADTLKTTAETLKETSEINKDVTFELRSVVSDLMKVKDIPCLQDPPTITPRYTGHTPGT
jgi:hypothetical protein